LRLGGIAAQYVALAQKAGEKQTSFAAFVEELLTAERESRRARAREICALYVHLNTSSEPDWRNAVPRTVTRFGKLTIR